MADGCFLIWKAEDRIRTRDPLFTKHALTAFVLLSLLYPAREPFIRSVACCPRFWPLFLSISPVCGE